MPVILITGSSAGPGYATAETPAPNGHTLYAALRNPQRFPQLQPLADVNHLPIIILPMDVLSDQFLQSATNFCNKFIG